MRPLTTLGRCGLALLVASAAVAQTSVVADVRAAIGRNDLAAATALVRTFRADRGTTPEALEALSWVARGTLVHALLHRYPEIAAVGGPGRPGIVHRLDKDTSGLLVVARTARAYRALVEAMRARQVRRTYQSLVWGAPRAAAGVIEGAIARDPRDRRRMAVTQRGGKAARTRWKVEERFGMATWLEIELDTGRTHQIRVHLAHLGHPVVGDPVYGGRAKKVLSLDASTASLGQAILKLLSRQALHASKLELSHPVTGRTMSFVLPLPVDFALAVETLRARSATQT